MRRFCSAPAVLAALAALATLALISPAAAIEYPWCAQYGGGDDGDGRNCGFVSREQCMETIRGMGGFCEQNLFYTGATERPAKPARKRRKDAD
ncbi:MAG TPA: DUF3551 domain-containing protein [Pseudolabrys sp.]|jgi:hypothetical protein